MKKYFAIIQLFFRARMTYRFDVLMSAAELAGRVLFAWVIWSAIYAQRATVAGLGFREMLCYYIASAIIAGLDTSPDVCSTLASGIRDGSFSSLMLLPISPQAYLCARTLGTAAFGGISAIFMLMIIARTSPSSLLLALVMIPLGLICMSAYYCRIGLMAFKYQDVSFFMYIQWTVRDFMTGSLAPLFLLPAPVQEIFALLPFPHVVYTPAMLLLGRATPEQGIAALAVLAAWTLALWHINQRTYQKLRVRYDGVGI